MLRLECVAQTYDWGIKGPKSSVGRLYGLSSGKEVMEDTPYAELWMGTHPSGPSKVKGADSAVLLKDWIAENPDSLGAAVKEKWSGDLPFLFKVLSVAKALSIQAHPDKKLAEELHSARPHVYKDDNHKPEMALAVTEFEALCGFVSMEELQANVAAVPELQAVLGAAAVGAVAEVSAASGPEGVKAALRTAFTALMTAEDAAVAGALSQLVARLESKDAGRSSLEDLILRLNQQYPADVGVFAAFFLNYLLLMPGQAIYLAANEPHAYLSGECVECMAASDNVVRAGLTPKLRDTDVLCSMLTYVQGKPDILDGTPVDECTKIYSPPFDEFEIEGVEVASGSSYQLPVSAGPSILLAFEGMGGCLMESGIFSMKSGEVFFLPAGQSIHIVADEGSNIKMYRAVCNRSVLKAYVAPGTVDVTVPADKVLIAA